MNEKRGKRQNEMKKEKNYMASESGTEQRQKEYTGGTIGMAYRREKSYTKLIEEEEEEEDKG